MVHLALPAAPVKGAFQDGTQSVAEAVLRKGEERAEGGSGKTRAHGTCRLLAKYPCPELLFSLLPAESLVL